tara:strand:+ start:782 stop:1132 length:351 start_codon:yes stop_codon:yes gene_type:complete
LQVSSNKRNIYKKRVAATEGNPFKIVKHTNESISVGVLPNSKIVTTVARSRTATVNDFLNTQVSGGEGSLAHNVDTVSESAGNTMSPAAAAVLRDVLIAHSRKVVFSVNVSPIPCI